MASKEEQLAAINKIMGAPEKEKIAIPYYVFPFGKYKGESLRHVYNFDRAYLIWLKNKSDFYFPSKVELFLDEEL